MADSCLLIGPASAKLGHDLATLLDWPSVTAALRVFPDGETCLDAVLPAGTGRCVIVQGTHPPQDRHLMQLLQLVQVARSQGVRHVTCVVPYLAYSRQDRRTRAGEAVTADIVLDMLRAAGAADLVCVDVHNEAVFQRHPMPCHSLSALPVFARELKARGFADPVLIASDAGGGLRLGAVAEQLGWPISVFEKFKADDGTTYYERSRRAFAGKDVVVLDDLCSSGSTLTPLVAELRACGAQRIVIGISHFFADEEALQRRLGADVELIYTDTTQIGPHARSVAPDLAAHLMQASAVGEAAQ